MYLDELVEEISKRPCIRAVPRELLGSIILNVIDVLDAKGIIGTETRVENV